AGAATGSGDGVSGAVAGATSVNVIADTTKARIENGSTVNAGAGGVSLDASDGSTIAGDSGGFAFALSKGKAISVGASVTVNTVTDTVTASVDGSNVSSAGGLDM